MAKWQFDLGARSAKLIARCEATIDLAARARLVGNHQTPALVRSAIAGSCLSVALDQQSSMGLLVATGRESSATMLLRPILESVCISAWALYLASDDALKAILKDETKFLPLASLITKLERVGECDWIGFKQKTANVSVFNALAHPSMLHLSKRYSPYQGAGAFSDEEGVRLLWLADTLVITCMALASVALSSKLLETWSDTEMKRLMSEMSIEWEGWENLPEPKNPTRLFTRDYVLNPLKTGSKQQTRG